MRETSSKFAPLSLLLVESGKAPTSRRGLDLSSRSQVNGEFLYDIKYLAALGPCSDEADVAEMFLSQRVEMDLVRSTGSSSSSLSAASSEGGNMMLCGSCYI